MDTKRRKTMFVRAMYVMVIAVVAFSVVGIAFAQGTGSRVGLIPYLNGVEDYSFNWMAYQGLLRAESDLGIIPSVYVPADESQFDAMLQQCADEGNELCIAVGFNYGVSLANMAKAYPDTKWAIVDYTYPDCWEGAVEGVDCGSFTDLSNVRGLRFNEKQAGYLAGVLAGEMTSSNTVGVVGGMEIPAVIDFVEGYRNGAQCSNPNLNVLATYTGTFIEPDLGAITAMDMIGQGADVIFGAAGNTGSGAILFSAQNGQWAIGVDADQYLTIFDGGTVAGSDKLLSSAIKRVDNAVYQTIADSVSGTFSSGTVLYDLAADGVGLAPFHEADSSIPQEVKDNLDAVKQDIIAGTINIDDSCPPPPTPFIWADPLCECINGWDWNVGDTITIQVFDQNGNELDLLNPTQVYSAESGVFFELGPEGINLQPGYRITMTNGLITKELIISKLVVKEMNPVANTISGVYDPAFNLVVYTGGQDPLGVEFDGDEWAATFESVPLDGSGEAYQPDEDGDKTGMGWDGVPRFMRYDIYAFDVESATNKRITTLDGTGEYDPSWSPFGKKVAHDVVYWDGSQAIYITDVATGSSHPLKGAVDGGNDAAWSPNGLWIAFDRRWTGDQNIYVVPFTGGQRRLVRENGVSPNWSPNGLRIVFQDLADGGKVKTVGLLGNPVVTIVDYGENPAWSPNGKWIAYQRDGDIWKVRVGPLGTPLGEPILVTDIEAWIGSSTWSEDSTSLVFDGGMTDDWDLWSVPASGGDPTWLTGVPEYGDYGPDFWKNFIAYASFSP